MIDKEKIKIDAPCRDANGHYPDDVHCLYQCERCGWNPAEIRRRIDKGYITTQVAFLRDENGFPYKAVFVKKYVLRRLQNNDNA